MASYKSINLTMGEEPMACEHPMYDNMSEYTSNLNLNFTGVKNTAKPLIEDSVETSNTQTISVPESAHDITVRTR